MTVIATPGTAPLARMAATPPPNVGRRHRRRSAEDGGRGRVLLP